MNRLSVSNQSANNSSLSADDKLHSAMSFYALIYGLGAVAVVIAVSVRGIIFMTVRAMLMY